MTLPAPPDDPSQLRTFPTRTVPASFPFKRIHHHTFIPEWFSADAECRFNPPAGSDAGFGTCYLAEHPLGAFIEKFGSCRPVTRSLVDQQLLATLQLVSEIEAADITDRTLVGHWGLTAESWAGGNYDVSQRWAERLHQAGFGGIWYAARHDPKGQYKCLAVLGKPGEHPDAFVQVNDDPIPEDLIEDAAYTFGIEVLPADTVF